MTCAHCDRRCELIRPVRAPVPCLLLRVQAPSMLSSSPVVSSTTPLVAADRKVADPLRSTVSAALASSLLADLSAIVVDYARTLFSIGTVRRVSTR
jgi:hypothetical protein